MTKKRLIPILLAAIAIPAFVYAAAVNPQRYHAVRYTFSGSTASISGAPVGVLPQANMRLVDVQISQASAGVGGTSWTATPKRNGTALVSTPGGFTLAAGATKATNVSGSPFGAIALPTGGTRPVISKQASATQTVTVGADLAADDVFYITSTDATGIQFTAKASGASGWQFNIGANENADATALAALINAHPSSPVVASATNAVITLTAKKSGTTGNSIAIGQTGDGYTLGGSTLAGGYDWGSAAGDVLTMDVTFVGTYSTAASGSVTLYFEPKLQ